MSICTFSQKRKEALLLVSSGAVFWCPLRHAGARWHQNLRLYPATYAKKHDYARELLYSLSFFSCIYNDTLKLQQHSTFFLRLYTRKCRILHFDHNDHTSVPTTDREKKTIIHIFLSNMHMQTVTKKKSSRLSSLSLFLTSS